MSIVSALGIVYGEDGGKRVWEAVGGSKTPLTVVHPYNNPFRK